MFEKTIVEVGTPGEGAWGVVKLIDDEEINQDPFYEFQIEDYKEDELIGVLEELQKGLKEYIGGLTK